MYRVGAEGCYDLYLDDAAMAIPADSLGPGGRPISPSIAIPGTAVVRGPDWEWKDQDKGGLGFISKAPSSGWVDVTWLDGSSKQYRVGDKKDLRVCKVDKPLALPGSRQPSSASSDGTV